MKVSSHPCWPIKLQCLHGGHQRLLCHLQAGSHHKRHTRSGLALCHLPPSSDLPTNTLDKAASICRSRDLIEAYHSKLPWFASIDVCLSSFSLESRHGDEAAGGPPCSLAHHAKRPTANASPPTAMADVRPKAYYTIFMGPLGTILGGGRGLRSRTKTPLSRHLAD